MRIDIFTKEQMFEGYLDPNASDKLIQIWFASIYYHGLDRLHEDLLCSDEYLYFNKYKDMCTDRVVPKGKKELHLWATIQ